MTGMPAEERRAALLTLQRGVLEKIATGETLASALDFLCRSVEEMAPGVVATILKVREGKLYPVAAPSVPAAYGKALEGAPIGPAVGSCGTAAWRGEPVIVTDIRTDPLWRDYQSLPLPRRLEACWSSPIKSREGKVIGTFAFYFAEKRGPSDLEKQIVEACVHLCAVAIESDLAWSETRRLAFGDALTGLMNRQAFQQTATEALARVERGGPPVAVHVIDIDEFKDVNDSLGHDVGDLLLKAIAGRLSSVAGKDDVVARLGGDEFAILERNASRESAADMAWRLLAALAMPFRIDDHSIATNASIGIAMAGEDGVSLAEIMKHADLALYGAKAAGRGRSRFFTTDLAETLRSRRAVAADLRLALERNELSLMFQPIVCLNSGALISCEALLRWHHPQRGEVPPGAFISLAEDLGLIDRIGLWVLSEACRQALRWPESVAISVNISPVQLRAPEFAKAASRIVADVGLPARRVTLEITETAVLANDQISRDSLVALRSAGFRLALDDFGTGYSSLKSLRAVPIDKLKIDQAFVREFEVAEASTSIVRAIVALAKSLGITTTAEGIETAEQARSLAAAGCNEGQGFHFSRPLSAEAVHAFCLAHQARDASARAAIA